jgi:hypothetical protein
MVVQLQFHVRETKQFPQLTPSGEPRHRPSDGSSKKIVAAEHHGVATRPNCRHDSGGSKPAELRGDSVDGRALGSADVEAIGQ